MSETTGTTVEVPWRTIFKLLAAAALLWIWLTLAPLLMVLVVAVLLAVALNPVIDWFERHGWARWASAALVVVVLLMGLGLFGWLTWTSISEQSSYATSHIAEFEHSILDRLPEWVRGSVGVQAGKSDMPSNLAVWMLRIGRSAISAVVVSVLALILTMYLVIEAKATTEWLLAFVPMAKRGKAEQTIVEAQRVIFAYVAGNVVTSMMAAVFVGALMTVLRVPAALLLALIAGLCDFVPVIGFVGSSIFAVAMALTVSSSTALLVFALYLAYHLVENYLISPWAYGDRLQLSNVAVILAFAVGADLAA